MKWLALWLLLSLFMLSSCGSKPIEEPTIGGEFDGRVLYDTYVERLFTIFVQNGWVTSRYENGELEHEGDSLIWTGIAMAAVPCERGGIFSSTLRQMMIDNDGALIRFDPLPEEYIGGREVSFDGAAGLYYGILHRILVCKEVEEWKKPWKLHMKQWPYLHPNVPSSDIAPEFTVLPDYISHLLGMRGKPHIDRVRVLEKQIILWARGVVLQKAACFRINLGWLYMDAMKALNVMSASGQGGFCSATEHVDIPLVDHWCGRQHIADWEHEPNTWEYRHQRCGSWESPDGEPGLKTPGLDAIMGYRLTL